MFILLQILLLVSCGSVLAGGHFIEYSMEREVLTVYCDRTCADHCWRTGCCKQRKRNRKSSRYDRDADRAYDRGYRNIPSGTGYICSC